jgi:2-aminoethylphosphonate-pyruvate transaminase
MPSRMVLMNPGPVLVDARVRQALLRPDICHREAEFAKLMTGIRTRLVHVCGGDESYAAVVVAGSGTSALEATLASVVPEHGKLLIIDNGHYGERLFRIARTHGICTCRLAMQWGNAVESEQIDKALALDSTITHVALVHHETSTGMLNPVHLVGEVVATHRRQFIVDAISSVGGETLDVRESLIDWCIGTANKCIESIPGAGFVCAPQSRFRELAQIPSRTFSLDLHTHYLAYETTGMSPFTPPVHVLYALECALDLLMLEGVANRKERYAVLARRLRKGMADLGFSFLLSAEHRSNTLTTFYLPDHLTYNEFHDRCKAEGFVIYASQDELQHKTFRVANMGQITHADIDRFIKTVEAVLCRTMRAV